MDKTCLLYILKGRKELSLKAFEKIKGITFKILLLNTKY